MLPRSRSSVKNAIALLQCSVSSLKCSRLKQVNWFHREIFKPIHIRLLTFFSSNQTNDTARYFRSQHKVELPPSGAKAAPAAMPKPPSPSTGANSSASPSSSSWQFRSSFPRDVRSWGAGALGALGTGALVYYSVNGTADGNGDAQKSSIGDAGPSFFNRLTEQIEFKDKFDGKPGVITVLIGPQSCGKTVRSAFPLQISIRVPVF